MHVLIFQHAQAECSFLQLVSADWQRHNCCARPLSRTTTRRQYKWQVKQRSMSLARGGKYPWDYSQAWKENPGHVWKQESSPGDQSVFIYSIYRQWQQQGCVLVCYEPRYRTSVTNALTAAVSSTSAKHRGYGKIREQGSKMQGMLICQ